jgi:hypothetical protein
MTAPPLISVRGQVERCRLNARHLPLILRRELKFLAVVAVSFLGPCWLMIAAANCAAIFVALWVYRCHSPL